MTPHATIVAEVPAATTADAAKAKALAKSQLARDKRWLQRWAKWLIPRPNTGSLGLDIVYLVVILIIQMTLIPSLTLQWLYVDILTIWLGITFIEQPVWRASILMALGAVLLETHLSVPRGLYLCVYCLYGTAIVACRHHLSWRQDLPWVLTFTLGVAGVILFESLVAFVQVGSLSRFDFGYFAGAAWRLAVAMVAGSIAAWNKRENDSEE